MWLQHPYHSTARTRRWRPLLNPATRARQQTAAAATLSKPSRSPAQTPRSIPPLLSSPQRVVRSPPSHGSSNIISCSSERQQIIIVFLGWEREAARTGGRAEEGTTESVNEGIGGSCVFLRRRTGSELGALARSRTATPSISIFFFLFLFIFLLLLLHRPFSFFHLSHFFEQIGWWRRNR